MNFVKLDRYYVRAERIVALEEAVSIYVVHIDLPKPITVNIKKDSAEAIDLLRVLNIAV